MNDERVEALQILISGLTVRFFKSAHFAVSGASSNPAKYGHKVLAWYVNHKLPVTPINPSAASILDIPSLESLAQIPQPESTSVSIITPPSVSLETVRQAAKLKVPHLWFQPGSYDVATLSLAKELGVPYIADGHCILVEGETILRSSKI